MELNGEEALSARERVYKWSGNLWRELELVNADDDKKERCIAASFFFLALGLGIYALPSCSSPVSSVQHSPASSFLCSSAALLAGQTGSTSWSLGPGPVKPRLSTCPLKESSPQLTLARRPARPSPAEH